MNIGDRKRIYYRTWQASKKEMKFGLEKRRKGNQMILDDKCLIFYEFFYSMGQTLSGNHGHINRIGRWLCLNSFFVFYSKCYDKNTIVISKLMKNENIHRFIKHLSPYTINKINYSWLSKQ